MKNNLETMIMIALIALIFGLIAILFEMWVSVIPMTILGGIAIQGYIVIPNTPPHIGVITRFGTRTNEYLGEGMGFLFLQGIVNDLILINMIKKNIDFDEQVLTTPDNVTTEVKTSLSYIPDQNNIINYLNNGKEDGIKRFVTDIEEEKLRIWSRSDDEPKTWRGLNSAGEEAVKLVLSAMCGEELTDTDVVNIRKGNGKWSIPHFGIILIRYNITKMRSFGEVYEASIKIEKEKEQRTSETFDVETDLFKAEKLQEFFHKKGKEIGIEEAHKIIMDNKYRFDASKNVSIYTIFEAIKNGGK